MPKIHGDRHPAFLEMALSALDTAVFRLISQTPYLEFELVNSQVEWVSNFFIGEKVEPFRLGELFPYLGAFFPDAESVWGIEGPPSDVAMESGIWTEKDIEGKEHQLEAIAFLKGGDRILIIQDQSRTFSEKQHLYQKAREATLLNEKLMIKINNHQRQFQSHLQRVLQENKELTEIEDNICHNTSAVLICKPDGHVEIMNQALIDIYDTNIEDPSKTSLLEHWLLEAEALYPEIQQVISSGRYWEGEFESSSHENENKWIHLVIGPVLDENNRLSRLICIANDISDVRRNVEGGSGHIELDFNTRLPNRRQFWRQLTKFIDLAIRYETNLALIKSEAKRS